jgi:hypothetical protein
MVTVAASEVSPGEDRIHYWIAVGKGKDILWIRMTNGQFKTARGMALSNYLDIPNVVRAICTDELAMEKIR